MKKSDVIQKILAKANKEPQHSTAKAFAPVNIALCKYWGKRNQELNLPVTSSLSISLANKGAEIELQLSDDKRDVILLNDQPVELTSAFGKRLIDFLNLFRDLMSCQPLLKACRGKLLQASRDFYQINIQSNIPIAAGLASSAAGFASTVKALNHLYDWNLPDKDLSILARLGSGSACRSIWTGFVEWHKGDTEEGFDSHGVPITTQWPELCIGLLIFSDKKKTLSSREAMQRTIETSPLYSAWPNKVADDLVTLRRAIEEQNFSLLGQVAESNALAMHATMISAWPPIIYSLPETLTAMQKIWQLRNEGLQLYFTQDAGPNLKLLFLEKDRDVVEKQFLNIEIVR